MLYITKFSTLRLDNIVDKKSREKAVERIISSKKYILCKEYIHYIGQTGQFGYKVALAISKLKKFKLVELGQEQNDQIAPHVKKGHYPNR